MLRELQAELERRKVELIDQQIRTLIEQSLSVWEGRIARELSSQSALLNELAATGRQAYVRYTFKVEFEDTSNRIEALFSDALPESMFDLDVDKVEFVKADVVRDFPEATSTPLAASREFALFGQGRHKRAWHLLSGLGGHLFESTLTFGSELDRS